MSTHILSVSLVLGGFVSLLGSALSHADGPVGGINFDAPTTVAQTQPPQEGSSNPTGPAIDRTIDKVAVPCDDQKPELGVRKCELVKNQSKSVVRDYVGHMLHYYYEGKLLAFDERLNEEGKPIGKTFCVQANVTTPMCSIANAENPEIDKNSAPFNQSCSGPITTNDGFCGYPVASDFSNCGREVSWLLGARAQVMQYHMQEVFDEIENGTVNLVDFSSDPQNPARMCGGYASAIQRLLHGGEREGVIFADKEVRRRFNAEELDTQIRDACPNDAFEAVADVGAPGTGEQSGARTPASGGFLSKISLFFGGAKLAEDTGSGSGSASGGTSALPIRQNRGISNAACYLVFARQNIEALFSKLAACEVYYRTAKTYHQHFDRAGPLFGLLTTQVIQPCIDYANSSDSGSGDFFSKYYQCYKGEVAGKLNVKSFFTEYIKERAPASEGIKFKKLGDTNDACPGVTL